MLLLIYSSAAFNKIRGPHSKGHYGIYIVAELINSKTSTPFV
jgi:hypothetical protein